MAAFLNGKPAGKPYESVDSITFSPDSKRLAYVAKRGSKWIVVVDGKATDSFDSILLSGPVFNQDGRTVAFGAVRDNQHFIVVNGMEIAFNGRFLLGGNLVFHDSDHLSSVIRVADKFKRLEINIGR